MSLRPRLDINLKHKPLEQISVLAPFSALMISVILVVFFFIRFYLLEGFLLRRLYGRIYADMNESARRGFVNHHIAGVIKMTILAIAIHPFINVAFLQSTFHSPYIPGSIVTMGDILVVTAQMLIAMYIFELLYRATLSPVAVLHHVGTILIGQAAIAISLNLASEPNADMEFVLCTAWGQYSLPLDIPLFSESRLTGPSPQVRLISSLNSYPTSPSSCTALPRPITGSFVRSACWHASPRPWAHCARPS